MRVSYSQISGYASCGERYRLERVIGVPQTPSWALVGGKALHAATEVSDNALLNGHPQPAPTTTFNDAFDKEIADQEAYVAASGMDFPRETWRAAGRASKTWPEKENEAWWRHHGPVFLANWQRWLSTSGYDIHIDDQGDPAIELEINLNLGEVMGEEVTALGYVDRVLEVPGSRALMVVDLKTGSRPQPTNRQLGFYRVGLKQDKGLDVPFGAFWDARGGGTSVPADLTHYTEERLVTQAHSLVAARLGGLYLPNPGSLCSSCSVKEYCFEYMGRDAIEVPQPVLTL